MSDNVLPFNNMQNTSTWRLCYSGPHCLQDESTSTVGFGLLWLSAIPLVSLCIVTLVANGAIILLYATRRKFRRCRNTYLVSLAVADFLIGLTMPVSAVETLGERWLLSPAACSVFLTLRYSLFFVTVMSIILITVDRWWSVHFPFSYRVRRSRRIAVMLTALVWVLSFLIHIPSTAALDLLHPAVVRHHAYCRVQYEYNTLFVVAASTIEFFIPLLVLFLLNIGIYIKLVQRRNSKTLRRSLTTLDTYELYHRRSSTDSDCTPNNSDELVDVQTLLRADRRRSSSYVTQSRRFSGSQFPQTKLARPAQHNRHGSFDLQMTFTRKRAATRSSMASIWSRSRKHDDDIVKDYLSRQDNKAILSLTMLVLMFVLCWTPHIVCEIVYSVCPCDVPMWALQMCYWILALNTALNPFLYGIGSTDIRRTVHGWLFCVDRHARHYRQHDAVHYQATHSGAGLESVRELEHSVGSGVHLKV